MKNKIFLSIIVPTYNAEEFIIKNIHFLRKKINKVERNFEIIIVNDGSEDNTKKILQKLKQKKNKIKIINMIKNLGKGAAIRTGLKQSIGENIIFIDCDLPYFESILKVYKYLKEDSFDLVVSSREKKPSKKFYKNWNFLFRRFFASFLNKIVRILIVDGFSDTQAGLKGFKRKVINKICKFKTNRFLFDIEILRSAKKHKLKIKKIFVKDKFKDYTAKHVTSIKFYLSTFFDLFYIILLILFKRI